MPKVSASFELHPKPTLKASGLGKCMAMCSNSMSPSSSRIASKFIVKYMFDKILVCFDHCFVCLRFSAETLQNKSGTCLDACGMFFHRICMWKWLKPLYTRWDPNNLGFETSLVVLLPALRRRAQHLFEKNAPN